MLVYLGAPDSAVVLIQRSKTAPSNEKTLWEFEKNVFENMEKIKKTNPYFLQTSIRGCRNLARPAAWRSGIVLSLVQFHAGFSGGETWMELVVDMKGLGEDALLIFSYSTWSYLLYMTYGKIERNPTTKNVKNLESISGRCRLYHFFSKKVVVWVHP